MTTACVLYERLRVKISRNVIREIPAEMCENVILNWTDQMCYCEVIVNIGLIIFSNWLTFRQKIKHFGRVTMFMFYFIETLKVPATYNIYIIKKYILFHFSNFAGFEQIGFLNFFTQ